jgi:flotillin
MPDKTWGLVAARPHEHLVHLRRGRVIRAAQGGSCFLLPGDTVALVDTSVQRLQFTADQVTREKVGVAVTGLAVLRVVEPMLAWRTLDLRNNGYRTILQEMFVGATRRLVANLSLEECLTRRKDALATELMAEVAPVVQGRGRADDGSDRGWGVAIDTIEIQDVRVLSDEVFRNLQAPYREARELEALQARATVADEDRRLEVERDRRSELARQAQMELEAARLEVERDRERQALVHERELADARQEAALARNQRQAQAQLDEAELQTRRARLEGELRTELIALERRAREGVSPERLQEILLTDTLPRVAEAFRESFGEVHLTAGEGALSAGLTQLMSTLRAQGVALPGGATE